MSDATVYSRAHFRRIVMMVNSSAPPVSRQWLLQAVTKSLLLALLVTFFVTFSGATAVPVVLSPVPKLQFFDASGRTLAFGCVFTYQSGTTTPLATYTDSTGTAQNTNPVILTAGGFAGTGSSGIWLQAGQAYTFKVVSAGGTNCATGSTLYTVDGVGGGLTLLTTIVVYSATPSFPILSQNQLFEITLTGNAVAQPLTAVGILPPAWVAFQITQDGAGGHTFTWPSNSVGGCTIGAGSGQVTTQLFVWNGTNATALGPCVVGNGPAINAGTIVSSSTITGTQLISTVAIGTPPLVVTSTTLVPNLNVGFLEGKTWEVPGTIGSTTPNSGVFTHLTANTDFTLNGSSAQTGIQGAADTKLMGAGTVTGTAAPLCTDANGGATTTCTGSGPIFAPHRLDLAAPVNMPTPGNQYIIVSESVTFPAAAGTYRALMSYTFYFDSSDACMAEVIDTTNNRAYAATFQDSNGGSGRSGGSGGELSSPTYAASATAVFTLQLECNGAGNAVVDMPLFSFSPAVHTNLSVTAVLSN